jgi:hypothetical protein
MKLFKKILYLFIKEPIPQCPVDFIIKEETTKSWASLDETEKIMYTAVCMELQATHNLKVTLTEYLKFSPAAKHAWSLAGVVTRAREANLESLKMSSPTHYIIEMNKPLSGHEMVKEAFLRGYID